MLTAEWVRARRRGGELKLLSLSGELREEVLGIAAAYTTRMSDAEGKTREAVQRSLDEIEESEAPAPAGLLPSWDEQPGAPASPQPPRSPPAPTRSPSTCNAQTR